jgi:hypothetical protein
MACRADGVFVHHDALLNVHLGENAQLVAAAT